MTLYRYSEMRWSNAQLLLREEEFPVIKETKCGAWIDCYGRKRFVNLGSLKKFACETKKDALVSFHARKRRQIRILESRLAEAKAALTLTPDNQRAGVFYYDLHHC